MARNFEDVAFECIFVNQNNVYFYQNSMRFVQYAAVYTSPLVGVMTWYQKGDKLPPGPPFTDMV